MKALSWGKDAVDEMGRDRFDVILLSEAVTVVDSGRVSPLDF